MVAGAKQPVDVAAIRSLLDKNVGALVRTWLSICSRCGLCADSCYAYHAHDKDPRTSPAFKVKSTLGEIHHRRGRVTREFLESCFEPLWLKCTACKRCSMHCPFGIDIAAMMMIGRGICYSQGVGAEPLLELVDHHRESGNHMGLPTEELTEVCEWMVEETEDEYRGIEIPIDKTGVKYMYTINPREVVFYPQEIKLAAVVLSLAEESWTMPTAGWDCTNLPMLAGDRALGGRAVKAIYDKALELGAEKILITECGHAYRSLKFEGPYMAGYADGMPPVEIVHFVQLLYEYLRDGRLVVDPTKRITKPITYQDPCNLSRNGGLWREARGIIGQIAEDFREMKPSCDQNHCCGGGSGLIPMGKEMKQQRLKLGRIKAEQIRATGAEIVIAPCHNCWDQVKDLSEKYELGVEVMSFKELLLDVVTIPEKFVFEAGDDE